VRGRGITRKGYPTYSKVFTGEFRGIKVDFYSGDDRGYYFRIFQLRHCLGISSGIKFMELLLSLGIETISVDRYQVIPAPDDLEDQTVCFLSETSIYEIAQRTTSKQINDFADYISSALIGRQGRLK
jgi:hypothetical protein